MLIRTIVQLSFGSSSFHVLHCVIVLTVCCYDSLLGFSEKKVYFFQLLFSAFCLVGLPCTNRSHTHKCTRKHTVKNNVVHLYSLAPDDNNDTQKSKGNGSNLV